MYSFPDNVDAAQESSSLRTIYRDGTIICIKCRQRSQACICRVGGPDDRHVGEIDRARSVREISSVAWISGRRAIDEQRRASPIAGGSGYSHRLRIVAAGPRRACRHDTLAAFRRQRDDIRRTQRPCLFLAPSPGRNGAPHRQRVFDGRAPGNSCGNDRNTRPSIVVMPFLPLHRARSGVASIYRTHLLDDARRTRGAVCVARPFRFQSHPNLHASLHAHRAPRFPGSAQVQSLYNRHRLYFRIDSRIWPDGLPRAPCLPTCRWTNADYLQFQFGKRKISVDTIEDLNPTVSDFHCRMQGEVYARY